MTSPKKHSVTRSVHLTTSLHYASLADFRNGGKGALALPGQSVQGMDNGYGLQGNPTVHELQDAVSHLEGGEYSLLYPSGLTALTALGALLKSGDHWVLPDSVYAPVLRYAQFLEERFSITYSLYDPMDLKTLQDCITSRTKLIHIESPSSVTFESPRIAQIVEIAQKHSIITSADNTWASGVLCQPLSLGVDISILSLTKYAAGYSDVFMGSITTSNKSLFETLAYHHRVYGYTVSPSSASLVRRGLESLQVRMAAHGLRAERLVEAIRGDSNVAKIYYASPQSSPELSGGNGLFSLELTRYYSDLELEKPLAMLEIFAIGESWGGTRSMVLPFQPEDLSNCFTPPQGTIVRFHAGLEDYERQLADIEMLLAQL
jgi:cystathionine beta-lyase